MTLADFVRTHPPQPPRIAPENGDQHRLLRPQDGLFALAAPPVAGPVTGRRGTPDGRYLWVMSPAAIPAILETVPHVQPPLQSGVAKHTNLTGGGDASCGGEMWVDAVNPGRLHITGGSGRYPPRSPAELNDAVLVLERLGFSVNSAGWDVDVDRPARVFR
jgi:hypothetical protein